MIIDGTVLTAAALANLGSIRHGFFTRHGGVSDGVYSSLNCGLGSKDNPSSIAENRSRVAAHLGAEAHNLVTLHQSHTAIALVVNKPFAPNAIPKADALVTRTPGLVVAALAADCAPVLFADQQINVVAAAHAGWRGAIGGILEATIAAMESLGSHRKRIRACVGPCINQSDYEVGPEFEKQVLNADHQSASFFATPHGKSRVHFDLPSFVAHRLALAGVVEIERQSLCTYANDDLFFSYRRNVHQGKSDYGRQISAIVVT